MTPDDVKFAEILPLQPGGVYMLRLTKIVSRDELDAIERHFAKATEQLGCRFVLIPEFIEPVSSIAQESIAS